jgi:hypothetical protein
MAPRSDLRLRRFRFFVLSAVAVAFLGITDHPSGNTLPVIGRVKTKHARDIASSPWGIQAGTLEREHIEKAAAIGVKWTRLQASWREIEREKGVYRWNETDRAFGFAIDNGITPFVCLSVSNRLYCAESKGPSERETEIYGKNPLPPTSDPAALDAWLRFVRAAVERYKGQIRYWEIWNEPNHWAYWGDTPNGREYGRLVRATSNVIRSVDPSAKIIAGALAGLDPDFTDAFLSDGGADAIDIITFHNYASLPEERIYKAVETWNVIERHRPSLELWQGECGYPSHSSTRDFRGTSPWGPTIQAKWLLRQAFVDVYYCRTTLSNYFKLVHEGGRGVLPKRSFMTSLDSLLGFPERNGSRVKSVGVNEKCILENPTEKPKPAYFAYQNLCAVMDGRYRRAAVPARTTVRDQGSFYGIGHEDDAFPSIPLVATFRASEGTPLVAYWLPWHPQETVRAATIDLSVADLTFDDPVLVDLLDGEVHPIAAQVRDGRTVFAGVPLTDYPYVIVERAEVGLAP